MHTKYTERTFLLEVTAILLAVLFLIPFYFVITNSSKSFAEILINAAAWPKEWMWNNYIEAWRIIEFPKALFNSLLVTTASNLGLVIISSMAAWRMVRNPSKSNQMLLLLFVAAMVVPFQSIMIPLVSWSGKLGLLNSIPSLVIMYFGFGASLNIFLYHGFIKSIPVELEDAARIDGCSTFGVFWRIIFPLLKPMTATAVILNSLWIWNDFLLPLLVLHNPDLRTIPLSTFSFFAEYTKRWDLALATLVMSVTPIVIFYLMMQKHIIKSIASGSLK